MQVLHVFPATHSCRVALTLVSLGKVGAPVNNSRIFGIFTYGSNSVSTSPQKTVNLASNR
jgi:hypothetical protein